MAITTFGYIGIFVGLLMIYPMIKYFQNYQKTKIIDYLVFSMLMLFGFLSIVGVLLRNLYPDNVLSWQFHGVAIYTVYLLVVIHASNIRWINTPKFVFIFFTIWYLVIIGMIPFYKLLSNQPDFGNFLIFKNFPRSYNNDHPNSAGIILSNGIIIFSQSYQLIGDLFRLLASLFALFAYITSETALNIKNTNNARKLFIVVWIFSTIYMLSLLPVLYEFFPLPPTIFLLIWILIIIIILLKYPECALLTKVQILKAASLYVMIEKDKSKSIKSIRLYIKLLRDNNLIDATSS